MILTGVIVNAVATALGAGAGILLKKGLPKRFEKILNDGLGLCILFVGISGALKGQQILVTIISIVLGGLIGELIDIDRHLNHFGQFVQQKLTRADNGGAQSTFAQGFVTSTMFICVGAMAIVGALESGINGNFSTYYTKALLDFIAVLIMTSALGIGCIFSSVVLFVYEGTLTLCAGLLSPLLTDYAIAEMTCVGSLLIIAIATNLLGITKIKVSNLLPAAFLPVALCLLIK